MRGHFRTQRCVQNWRGKVLRIEGLREECRNGETARERERERERERKK